MRNNRERGGIIGGLLSFFGILVVCGVCLVAILGWVVTSRVKVSGSQTRGETRVETPFGSVTVRERARLDPAALGVPVYPGAQRLDDTRKLASFELDLGDTHKDFTVAVAEYVTDDSLAAVEAFYRDSLRGARVRQNRERRIVLEVEGGTVKKMVALRERDRQTHISLASVTGAAAN